MGVNDLCNAVASAVSNRRNYDNVIKRAKISGEHAIICGRTFSYSLAVDIPISDGEWVYVAIASNKAVVVGK